MRGNFGDERLGSSSHHCGQRADRIAQLGRIRLLVVPVAVGQVDEAAVLIDVDQRVDERALPRREQRGSNK